MEKKKSFTGAMSFQKTLIKIVVSVEIVDADNLKERFFV